MLRDSGNPPLLNHPRRQISRGGRGAKEDSLKTSLGKHDASDRPPLSPTLTCLKPTWKIIFSSFSWKKFGIDLEEDTLSSLFLNYFRLGLLVFYFVVVVIVVVLFCFFKSLLFSVRADFQLNEHLGLKNNTTQFYLVNAFSVSRHFFQRLNLILPMFLILLAFLQGSTLFLVDEKSRLFTNSFFTDRPYISMRKQVYITFVRYKL